MPKSLRFLAVLFAFGSAWAQISDEPIGSGTALPLDTLNVGNLRAHFGLGFSYDVLRDPTNVSFEHPEGRTSFNVPISLSLPQDVSRIISQKVDTALTGGNEIYPDLSGGQQLNLGFRVNVPLMGGVASFAYNNNVDIDYMTSLGNSNVRIDTSLVDSQMTTRLLLKGYIDLPLNARLGWRTLTFGYAIQPIRGITLAFNMNRHIFELMGNANISVDLLGQASVTTDLGALSIPIEYSSSKVFGYASTKYRAEAWSPTFGLRVWRLGLTSRLGVDTRAEGSFDAVYKLPFFVKYDSDERNFVTTLEGGNVDSLMLVPAFRNDLQQAKSDSVAYHSKNSATWKLPQGHTVTLDLIKRKLFLSYTQIIGDIEMQHDYEGDDGALVDTLDNRNDLDLGITVGQVVLLGGRFRNSNFNVGLFTMDMRVFNDSALIGNAMAEELQILGAPTFPILSFGSSFGTTMRMLLQLDLLPLPSFRTGLVYYF